MIDSTEDRLIITPNESAEAASPRSDQRREFLRRLSVAVFAIPAIGGVSYAEDKKKKNKKDKADEKASSGSSSSTKTASSNAKASSSSKAKTAKKPPGTSPHGAHDTSSPHSSTHNATSSNLATPDTSKYGKPLPELYIRGNGNVFEQIQTDENSHVAFLVNALGTSARPMPTFQNLTASTVEHFAAMSRNFENTGVGAYLGALPLLAATSAGIHYVPAAGSLALIEARHSGYLNTLLDLDIVENIQGSVSSFEQPLTPDQVVSAVSPFIESLNGGPPPIPAGGLVQAVDILNFALILEYLEATFYNLNVPVLINQLCK